MICIKLVHAVDSVGRGIERQLADYRMNGEREDRIGSRWGGREEERHSVLQSLKFRVMELIGANA